MMTVGGAVNGQQGVGHATGGFGHSVQLCGPAVAVRPLFSMSFKLPDDSGSLYVIGMAQVHQVFLGPP